MNESPLVYLGLGSNLGDKADYLCRGLLKLTAGEFHLRQISSIYLTPPWGFTQQDPFFNMVVSGVFSGTPQALLLLIQEVEKSLGRDRSQKWGPRTIDIDILLFGEMKSATETLVIPHPWMAERQFVLSPLAEIAPELWLDSKQMSAENALKQMSQNESGQCEKLILESEILRKKLNQEGALPLL
jgi:2-amino-4-hydroxy-6-hydroxymethyldihydropteridine diphosphokinase